MSDCHADPVPTPSEIERLPCSVVLPAALEADFEQQGPAPTFPGCKRRFPRFRCRGKSNLIALEHRQSLPGLPRGHAWLAVYLAISDGAELDFCTASRSIPGSACVFCCGMGA